MKRKRMLIIVFSVICAFSFMLSGCSLLGTTNLDPKDIISDAYGNEQFTISFNAEELDEPLANLTYTANSMPKLPTPTRVGYIFEGWYLDSDYTIPYFDGILYLYMCDVTLYANWSREEFVQNGTYDIEYEVKSTSELDENVPNIIDAFIEEEIYIEKSNDKLMLRIQYDCGTVASFGQLDRFILTSASTSVLEEEDYSIDSETSAIKTVYFNIEDVDIADPFYFNVTATDADNSVYFYTIEFKITRLIGFSRPYADPSVPLDDGYYLVNTYFRSIDGEDVMGESYNPVYSYVYAENGNYTLIKPFIPYTGMTGINDETALYSRATAFFPMLCYYDSAEGSVYGELTVEFNADTGRLYNIFELGNDVQKNLYVTYAITGPMEPEFHYGARTLMIEIDYSHMIRVTDIDYISIDGDYYQYTDSFVRHGENSPARSSNAYAAMSEYGLSYDMVNFYFMANDLSDQYEERTQLSSRITYTPVTNSNVPATDLTYSTTQFVAKTQIYGYDEDQNLYADVMSVGNIVNRGMRDTKLIRQGKSLSVGENVDLTEIYTEKVDAFGNMDEDNVSYSIYAMKDGEPNYGGGELSGYGRTFTFSEDIAVVFTRVDEEGNTSRTVVELIDADANLPNIYFEENGGSVYDGSDTYNYGDTASIPALVCEWGGVEKHYISGYYYEDELIAHPLKMAIYYIDTDGDYVWLDTSISNVTTVEHNLIVVYELTNVYGERLYYEAYLNLSSPPVDYCITMDNSDGTTVLESGTISYDNGERVAISAVNDTTRTLFSVQDIEEALNEKYSLTEGEESYDMPLWAAAVMTPSETVYFGGEEYTVQNIADSVVKQVTGVDYAFIVLQYKNGTDRYTQIFIYNITFDGLHEFDPLDVTDVFSSQDYTFRMPSLISTNGYFISSGLRVQIYNEEVNSFSNGFLLMSSVGNVYTVNFTAAGNYDIIYYTGIEVSLDRTLFGNISANINFRYNVEVLDGYGTGTITFVAADGHPFAAGYDNDGDGKYTVTISLHEIVQLLSGSEFETNGATLYGWSLDLDADFTDVNIYAAGATITDYIGEFNAQNITLYAIWDEKLEITFEYGDSSSRVYTYSLTTSSSGGRYVVSTNSIVSLAQYFTPNGQELIGFIGGFFGDDIVSVEDVANTYYIYDDAPLTIKAVYAPIGE